MPTGPDRLAVLALQLARTDRRALSQAWYDALHCAHGAPVPQRAPQREQLAAFDPERPLPLRRRANVQTPPPAAARERRAGAPPRVPPSSAGGAAHRITRTAIALTQTPRQLARTVLLGTTRVRLVVRTGAGGTRVVAICAAADRDRVARALAEVRVALAGAGVTVAA